MLKSIFLLALGSVALLGVSSAHACEGRLHMEVGPSGVYSLDYADAVAAQPGLSGCAVAGLQLVNHGREVPIQVIDNGDGVFGEGDHIVWIGLQLHGAESWSDPYSRVNVYELGHAAGTRLRFETVKPPVATGTAAGLARHLHLENDHLMIRLKTDQVKEDEQPDVWYWAKMTMVDPQPFSTKFDLPGLLDNNPHPSMKIGLRGLSKVHTPKDNTPLPDHHVVVRLNNHNLAALDWDGDAHIERTLSLPQGLLRLKDNTLSLEVPGRIPPWSKDNPVVDVVMFDYLDLTYPLGDQVSNGREPFEVVTAGSPRLMKTKAPLLYGNDGRLYRPGVDDNAARYGETKNGTRLFPLNDKQTPLTPVGLRPVRDSIDWRHPEHGYDYVMLAHPSLMDTTEPLAEFHRQRGLKVAVINVDDAYDQFNHGIVNPRAIRDLLAWAHHNWPAPRPSYVLLVGDASFDIHNTVRDQKYYSKWTDRELLFPGQFGTIPGTPYSDQPKSAADRNLIPTFQYFAAEGQSASDNAFVAFDEDSVQPSLAIGRFPVTKQAEVKAIVDKTIAYVEHPRMGDWRQSVMFITNDDPAFQTTSNRLAQEVGDLGFSPSRIYPSSADKDNTRHQQKIMQDLDSGQLLVHFLGHGGRYIWRTGPPDPSKNHDLFTLDNVADLKNAGKLPMILSMTCYSAPFDNPTEDSIGERFLREPDNGAVAVFAASWRNAPDVAFSKSLLKDLVTPGVRIGDAILKAKRDTQNRDMIEMYNLLGDPAIALQRPRETLDMVQVRDRWNPGVVIRVPEATEFHGRLKVQWLDDQYQVLSDHEFDMGSPQLRLPPAPAGAHQVRAYAFDPAHGSDALGELTLTTPKPERPWWKPAPRPKPLPPASDRIYGSNFGG